MKVDVMFSCDKGHERVYFDCWSCPVCDAIADAFDDKPWGGFLLKISRRGQVDAGGASKAMGD